MKDFERQAQDSGSSTEWDEMSKVPFAGGQELDGPREEAIREELGEQFDNEIKQAEYLRGKLAELTSQDIHEQIKHSDEITKLRQQVDDIDPLRRAEQRQASEARQEQEAAEHAELKAEREQTEQMRAEQTERENIERFGSNIPAVTARNAFNTEYYQLKRKYDKIKRLQEKELNMSPKEREKSERQRRKDDLIYDSDEAKHLAELQQLHEQGGHAAAEDYGRRKEAFFSKIQAAKAAHPFKFRQVVRRDKLDVPRKFDDPDYSLDDLRRVSFQTDFLLQDNDK